VRFALAAVAVVALTGCGSHRTAAPRCTLAPAPTPVPETGEHTVAFESSCALRAMPTIRLFGQHGARLPFALVAEGGPKGTHTVMLDKYRCDVRYRDFARTVEIGSARLDVGPSRLDWCPVEAPSTTVRVYLGALRRAPPSWRGVFRDVYDGRLDRVWPCGALRTAIAHLPVDGSVYSTIPRLLTRVAAHTCADAIADLPVGSPRAAFLEALGDPSVAGQRCTVWKWAPANGAVDGVRACFRNARAVIVQTALHG
jgi:hypothetical protein